MIGPVDSKCAKALCQAHREVRLPANADEVLIFYNLSMDRVHYFPQRNSIYFVESVHACVDETIRSVLVSLGSNARIDQLYLDEKGIFKGGKRIVLPPRQARVVLTALCLQGIQIALSDQPHQG
jgi:hypothetical protein